MTSLRSRTELLCLPLLTFLVCLLPGCSPPTQAPGTNPNPPTLTWTIYDETTRATAVLAGSTEFASMASLHSYLVSVEAQSPDGISQMTMSGTGTFQCYMLRANNPNSQNYNAPLFLNTSVQNYPLQSQPYAPPMNSTTLSQSFSDPCPAANPAPVVFAGVIKTGTVEALTEFGSASIVKFTASATNASGKQVNGTLTLEIPQFPITNAPTKGYGGGTAGGGNGAGTGEAPPP